MSKEKENSARAISLDTGINFYPPWHTWRQVVAIAAHNILMNFIEKLGLW